MQRYTKTFPADLEVRVRNSICIACAYLIIWLLAHNCYRELSSLCLFSYFPMTVVDGKDGVGRPAVVGGGTGEVVMLTSSGQVLLFWGCC